MSGYKMVKTSQKFGFPMVITIGKQNKMLAIFFWTIEQQNFKTFVRFFI